MENAGKEISVRSSDYNSIALFCGTGNNGGDGLVAARHLANLGKRVKVYSLKGERSEENKVNFEILSKLDSVELSYITDSSQTKELSIELREFDCIIDSLIGTGISGELREPVKSIVEACNSAKAFRIAVDLPTKGFKSDIILSFHLSKAEGAEVVDIGIPKEAELYAGPGDVFLSVPKRKGDEHKGAFGRVLVVGGCKEYIGTPLLVARAALRAGADLSFIASPSYVLDKITVDPNLIYIELDSDYYLSKEDVNIILDRSFDSLVIGNGLGTEEESRRALKKLLKGIDTPVVLDADALKLIKERDLRRNSEKDIVVTPHRSEFELLYGEKPDNSDIVKECAARSKSTVLLKSEVDIVSDGVRLKLNRSGNAGMTVGGTGDVLAGILGALVCNKKIDSFTSASAAAFISGLSGDLCMQEKEYSYIATDVLEKIPEALIYCKKFI